MAQRGDKIRYCKALKERLIRESRSDLLRFTLATMPTFRRRLSSPILQGLDGLCARQNPQTNGVHATATWKVGGFDKAFARIPFGQ